MISIDDLTEEEKALIENKRAAESTPQFIAQKKIDKLTVDIDLLIAQRKEIHEKATDSCDRCKGRGGTYSQWQDDYYTCSNCDGTGRTWK